MLVAMQRHELVERLVMISGGFNKSGEAARDVDQYDALPNAEPAVVPGTSHFLIQEKPGLVNTIVLDFLTNDPVPTVAPIRRAAARAADTGVPAAETADD
jgi:hypothetical protein